MSVALTSLGMLVGAWLVHLAVWRIRLPRNHTLALLVIFFCVGVATPTLSCVIAEAPKLSLPEWALVLLAYGPGCLSYVILYSLLESQSPSLDLVAIVDKAGKDGMALADLRRIAMERSGISGRLRDFESGGVLRQSDDALTLTGSGARLGAIFSLLSRLLAVSKGG